MSFLWIRGFIEKLWKKTQQMHLTFSETMIKLNWPHNYGADLRVVSFLGGWGFFCCWVFCLDCSGT